MVQSGLLIKLEHTLVSLYEKQFTIEGGLFCALFPTEN